MVCIYTDKRKNSAADALSAACVITEAVVIYNSEWRIRSNLCSSKLPFPRCRPRNAGNVKYRSFQLRI